MKVILRQDYSADSSPDICESLVSALEHASALPFCANINEEVLCSVFEKGAIYKAYIDLNGLTLVEQVLYLFQKFSEYNDR